MGGEGYRAQASTIECLRKRTGDPELFEKACASALDYMASVPGRRVFPSAEALEGLKAFDLPLPDSPTDPEKILALLHEKGSPATVTQTGGRYFGFVNGGILPGALAAKWLADSWDQNAALNVISPIASALETVCERWLVDLLGFPEGTAAGFVSGTATASLCALAAGRDALLLRKGWDSTAKGLFGAPELRVVLGAHAHSTVYKALSILGLGKERLVSVPADSQGRMIPERIPELDDSTLLILQAGNVNTGAFDRFEPIMEKARKAEAWVHVDGAFGLWAAASEGHAPLMRGCELADSWSADAHKTLNAPYDNGIVLCRDREALMRSMHMTGSYIVYSEERDGMRYTPDMSRRARGVEVWATLMSLGRKGVSELVDDLCAMALRFAQGLSARGFLIRNEVCFNQVLVSCGTPELTRVTLEAIQESGECWCGGAVRDGEPVIRISVCSYMTGEAEVERSIEAFAAARDRAGKGIALKKSK